MNESLKLLRRYHGWQQKDLAEKLGISSAHLCGIEKGKKQPSLELLQRYSEICNVPLSSLVYFVEQIEGRTSRNQRPISEKILGMLSLIEKTTRV